MGQRKGDRHEPRYWAQPGVRLASLPVPSLKILRASYLEQLAAARRAKARNEHTEAFHCLRRADEIKAQFPQELSEEQIRQNRWR